jgi:hypothetical protein
MNGLVSAVLMLVVPGCCGGPTLDKTGTLGCEKRTREMKTLKKQEPANAGSFLAEREGF